jgi:hypothetical protein
MNAKEVLEAYLLQTELAATSIEYYRKSVQVFERWAAVAGLPEFSAESVSRFLLAKQEAGKSSHYRASLRNALRALLRFAGCKDKLRQVKLGTLAPAAWTPAEIAKLITACGHMPDASRDYWETLIAAAWYTGLSQADLHRVRLDDFAADGTLEIARRKTGRIAFVAVQREVLDRIRPHRDGRCWPLLTSREWFRRTFAKIVKRAGLAGTFPKIRKSSGTYAEIANPGRGHEHLANSRKVFETNYLSRRHIARAPLSPPTLPRAG